MRAEHGWLRSSSVSRPPRPPRSWPRGRSRQAPLRGRSRSQRGRPWLTPPATAHTCVPADATLAPSTRRHCVSSTGCAARTACIRCAPIARWTSWRRARRRAWCAGTTSPTSGPRGERRCRWSRLAATGGPRRASPSARTSRGAPDATRRRRIVATWLASPPHREVMLSPEYRDAGVSVALAVPAVLHPRGRGATYVIELGARLARL